MGAPFKTLVLDLDELVIVTLALMNRESEGKQFLMLPNITPDAAAHWQARIKEVQDIHAKIDATRWQWETPVAQAEWEQATLNMTVKEGAKSNEQ